MPDVSVNMIINLPGSDIRCELHCETIRRFTASTSAFELQITHRDTLVVRWDEEGSVRVMKIWYKTLPM
jgi:hypothetical protein